jgi:uncharacterized membrane protein YdbT with pleckstrin-like domain
MDLIAGEALIWEGKPSWRSTVSFLSSWALAGLVPLAVILIVRAVSDTDWPIWVGVVIFVAVLVLGVLVGWIRRYFTQYMITDKRIAIRQGVLAKREQTAHIDRLQNVTINQTFLDRLFGVGMVDFDTAGSDTAELKFYGIDDPQALRDRIATEYLTAPGSEAEPTRGGV